MRRYSIEPRTRKYVKGYKFLSSARKYIKKLSDTGLDCVKTASKKEIHKIDEFIRNKIAGTVTKSNDNNIKKQEPVQKLRKRLNIKQIEKSIMEMVHYKISKLLNDSTVLKLVTKNGLK